MPFFLGYERPMNYLVLIQITDELRPTGGFLRAIIFVRLENGQPTQVHPYDIQELEPPGEGSHDWVNTEFRRPPPSPFEKYMGLGNWVIRDANWWGDFRDSAQEIVDFWYRKGLDPVDGVIAVNDRALASILTAVGGITLPDGTVLNGDTFKDYAIEQFYKGERSTWFANQLAASHSLTEIFINAVAALPRLRLLSVFGSVSSLLNSHDIMITVFDEEEIAATLNTLGFDGSLRTEDATDYVYLVASNVSYSKSSPFIHYEMTYSSTLDTQGVLNSQLDINISNHYSRDLRLGFPDFYYEGMRWNPATRQFYANEGYYGEYTRIFLLPDVVVLNVTGFDSPTEFPRDPSRLKVVGGYVGLESGETQHIQIQWQQAQVSLDEDQPFRLYFQREPGLPPPDLAVHVTYPDCAAPVSAALSPQEESPGTASWQAALDYDREFTLDLSNPAGCIAS
jgi:hypothetical protein